MYMQSVKLIGGVKAGAVCLHRAGSGDNSVGCVDEGTVCTDGSARICADPGNDFLCWRFQSKKRDGRRHQRIKADRRNRSYQGLKESIARHQIVTEDTLFLWSAVSLEQRSG